MKHKHVQHPFKIKALFQGTKLVLKEKRKENAFTLRGVTQNVIHTQGRYLQRSAGKRVEMRWLKAQAQMQEH